MDEIEIDFEILKDSTLRDLYDYVSSCLMKHPEDKVDGLKCATKVLDDDDDDKQQSKSIPRADANISVPLEEVLDDDQQQSDSSLRAICKFSIHLEEVNDENNPSNSSPRAETKFSIHLEVLDDEDSQLGRANSPENNPFWGWPRYARRRSQSLKNASYTFDRNALQDNNLGSLSVVGWCDVFLIAV